MAKKVLIFGGNGMLGHITYDYLKKNSDFQAKYTTRRKDSNQDSIFLDISKREQIDQVLQKESPNYIINCIGILISGSIKNPASAIYANAFFPHYLSFLARKYNARLIHISTDCVFSGEKGNYIESDIKDGFDLYAKSKALGEIDNEHDLTLRTSIIGPELIDGEGLLNWFLSQRGDVNGFTQAIWSGVTSLELAKVISFVMKTSVSGIYHVTNNTAISKYDLLNSIKSIFHINDINLIPKDSYRVNKSIVDTRHEINYKVSPYKVMIQELYDYMLSNKSLYTNYNL